MPGTLFVVATPIGNLEDITVRALRVLREVQLIAAEDTRRTAHLLARHAITTPCTSLHEHNETGKAAALVARLKTGENIALVSDAGTPTVSDPGERLIRAAIESGIRVEPIPGASAVLAALAVSGFSTESFAFFGFPPTRSKDRNNWFERILAVAGTVVFFEAPHRIRETLDDLQSRAGDIEVAVGRELTKAHEQLVRGPISSVLKELEELRGEFTVVASIGQTTESKAGPADVAVEFYRLTNNEALSKRQAVARLAKKHGVSANDVYKAIEQTKIRSNDRS